MGHREDLLNGAIRCLREKGYAHTTARDIVAASGTNLGSIGYHYGSTQALLNAAVLASIEEFGKEMERVVGDGMPPDASPLDRFERFWENVINSFRDNREVWLATFDIFSVAQRDPDIREAISDGLEDGRIAWGNLLYGGREHARDVGSLIQALLSGVLVQWLIDPDRAPSPGDLSAALASLARQICDGRAA